MTEENLLRSIDSLSEIIANQREKLDAFRTFAKAHEAWEAGLIMDEKETLLENLTDESYDEMLRIQNLRNEAMKA